MLSKGGDTDHSKSQKTEKEKPLDARPRGIRPLGNKIRYYFYGLFLLVGLVLGVFFAWHFFRPPKAILGTQPPTLSADQNNDKSSFKKTFTLDANGWAKSKVTKNNKREFQNSNGQKITTKVLKGDQVVDFQPDIQAVAGTNGKFVINFAGQQFQPGKYTLKVDLDNAGDIQTLTQDFTWGVLAVNVRRSYEQTNTKVEIGMSVLNDMGQTQCDAKVELDVTDPRGKVQHFSTDNKTVVVDPACADRTVTDSPDYAANYITGNKGTYTMTVTATIPDGTRSISDTFVVKNDIPFNIERTIFPTRIYPVPNYPVQFTITANKDYKGLVTETVPAGLQISKINQGVVAVPPSVLPVEPTSENNQPPVGQSPPSGTSSDDQLNIESQAPNTNDQSNIESQTPNPNDQSNTNDQSNNNSPIPDTINESPDTSNEIPLISPPASPETMINNLVGRAKAASNQNSSIDTSTIKTITWHVDWQKGGTYKLGYTIDFPNISPEFYLLGPLQIGSFKESRQWQIAADANTCTYTEASTPQNWNGLTWVGCTGESYPGQNVAGDIVQITSGVASAVLNLNVSPAQSLASVEIKAAATAMALTFGAYTLNVTTSPGTVTVNQATAAVTNAINVNTGTLNTSGNISLPGTTTTASYIAQVVTTSGTTNVGGSIVFSTTNTTVANAVASVTSGTLRIQGAETNTCGTIANLTSAGTIQFDSSYTHGSATCNPVFTTLASTSIKLGGNLSTTNSDTLTFNATSTAQHTASGTVTGSGLITYGNVQINSGATITLGSVVTVAGNWTNNYAASGSGGLSGNYTVTMSGASKTIGGTATTPFYGFIVANAATLTLNTNATVGAGNFTFATGSTATTFTHANGIDLTVTGGVTINQPSGAVTKNWLINAGTASVTGEIIIPSTSTTTTRIARITITTGTLNANGGIDTSGATGGSTAACHVIYMSGSTGTFNLKGAIQTVNVAGAGGWTFTMGTSGSNFVYNDTLAQTVYMPGSGAYNNLVSNNTNASGAILGANITTSNVTGNITVNSNAKLDTSSYTIGLGGNLDVDGTLSGSGAITLSGTSKTIDGTGSVTDAAAFTVGAYTVLSSANITIAGAVTVSNNTTLTNQGTLTLTNASSIAGGNTNAGLLNDINAYFKASGTVFPGNGNLTASANGNTVEYNGAGQTVKATTDTYYYHVILSGSGSPNVGALGTIYGNLTTSGSVSVTTTSSISVGGALNVGNGTSLTVGAGYTLAVTSNVTVTSNGTITNNSTGGMTVSGDLTGTGGLTQGSNAVLNLAGAASISGLTANTSGNTVNYNGTTQTVNPTSYYNLTLSNSGVKTMTSVATIGGDLTVSGSATMTDNGALSITGQLAYSSSGSTTLKASTNISMATFNQTGGTINDNAVTITVSGTGVSTWTESGTFSNPTGTVNFTGTAPQIGASNFNNLTISVGASATITGALDVNGDFLLSSGTFNCNSQNQTFAGAFQLNNGTTYTKGGTLTFDKAGSQDVADATAAPGQDLGAVTIGPSTTTTVTTSNKMHVTSLIIGADDVMDISGDTLTISGTGTPFTQGHTFTTTGSTVVYNGTGSATNITATIYNNLTLTPSGTTTYTLVNNLSNGTAMTGALTVNNNATLDTQSGSNYGITTTQLTINTGGAVTANNSAITLTGATIPFNRAGGTFTAGGSTVVFTATSATASMFYATGSPTHALNNVEISPVISSAYTDTLCSAACVLNIGGTFLINPQTGAFLLTVAAANTTLTVTGTTTIQKNGASTTSKLTTAASAAVTTFGNLTISTGGTYAPGSASTTYVNGSFTNNGTFTANSDTVQFQSTTTATVAGSTSFYNLTLDATAAGAKEIDFTAGTTQTITHTFSLTGAVGKVLTIKSTSDTNAWYFVIPADINPSGDYIDVRDSQNITNAYRITPGANCTDSGNNVPGWLFAAPNSPPTNDSLTFTNPYTTNTAVSDDTTSWDFQAKVTDTDGPTNLNYVELHLANSADSTQPYDSLKFRWTEATDTFSEEADTQNSATLTSTNADSNAVGNQWTLNFKFKINNNFLAKDTNYAAELYSLDDASASDTDNYANLYQVTALSLSLDVDNASLSFGSLLPGSIVTGTTVTTVTTNYPNGYALDVSDGVAGSDSALLHTDTTTRIADYAGTIATPTTWTDTGLGICVWAATNKDAKWGTGVSEIDPNNKYAGVPQTATTITSKTGSPTSGDQTSIGYKLVVPNSQKTGDYAGDVTYTATGALL